jgi:hypothetical protein
LSEQQFLSEYDRSCRIIGNTIGTNLDRSFSIGRKSWPANHYANLPIHGEASDLIY